MARSRRYGGRSQQNRGQQNYNNNGGYSPRQRQNAVKNIERYLNMAKDASANGDVHQAENYYQYADHYHRVAHANDDHNKKAENNTEDNTEENVAEENSPETSEKTEQPKRGQSRRKYTPKSDSDTADTQPHSVDAPQPDVPQHYTPPVTKPENVATGQDVKEQSLETKPVKKPRKPYVRKVKPATESPEPIENVGFMAPPEDAPAVKPKRKYVRRKKVEVPPAEQAAEEK